MTAGWLLRSGYVEAVLMGLYCAVMVYFMFHTMVFTNNAASGHWNEQVDTAIQNRNLLAYTILHNKPFILYLRDFGSERPVAVGSAQDMHFVEPTYDEKVLLGSVPDGTRLFAPTNISDQSAWPPKVQRFSLRHEEWMHVISTLIEHASLIVVWIRSPTPGIMYELGEISRKNRQPSCVLLRDTAVDQTIGEIATISRSCLVDFQTSNIPHMYHGNAIPNQLSELIGRLAKEMADSRADRFLDDSGMFSTEGFSSGDILDQLTDLRRTDQNIRLVRMQPP